MKVKIRELIRNAGAKPAQGLVKQINTVLIGWQRWSNEYLYGVLGLYWDWKVRPLESSGRY
ncbi:hypothetical protein BLD50_03160 [Bacillus cereus]|nr:hypothetical protein BLD50_03160 [Bacillus cereus]